MLESIYEECLAKELELNKLQFERRVVLPISYKGFQLKGEYRLDFLVEDRVIIELKSVESILPVHKAQLPTYLKLTRLKLGLIINFNVPVLKDGIVRLVL